MQEKSEMAGKTWVLTLTSVASFMVALDALVVTTALSRIRIDLGASIEALEWTVNAYNLSFAVLLLTGAALGDRFGRRRGTGHAAGDGTLERGVPTRGAWQGAGDIQRRHRARPHCRPRGRQ